MTDPPDPEPTGTPSQSIDQMFQQLLQQSSIGSLALLPCNIYNYFSINALIRSERHILICNFRCFLGPNLWWHGTLKYIPDHLGLQRHSLGGYIVLTSIIRTIYQCCGRFLKCILFNSSMSGRTSIKGSSSHFSRCSGSILYPTRPNVTIATYLCT